MKNIPLTQGKVALVDDDDYEWLIEDRWHCTVNAPTKLYAARHLVVDGVRKTIYMHRVIMGDKILEIDHIDGDCLNNAK